MLLRHLREEEKTLYNQVVDHPVQSWEWGEFRKKNGLKVERIGFFENGVLKKALQVTFHPLPIIGKTAGYLPKAFMPDEEQLASLEQLGKKHNALFIKMEPNVAQAVGVPSAHHNIAAFLIEHNAAPAQPLFHRYTYLVDLTQSEEKLFANLSSKTRYNVNLAFKKGVQIYEQTSDEGLETYLSVQAETTTRQGFYAHNEQYFRDMWAQLKDTGMMRIFHAVYEDTVLVTWIMFVFNGVLYYPYGASRAVHRDVMASNLMLWEMIKFGREVGCHTFDLWGTLGPDADPKHPWYGVHRFKKGYGGTLVESIGTYDLVLNQPLYKLFRIADNLRWKLLRLKARFRKK